MPGPTKRRSGPTQPEAARKRAQKLLRLSRWHREQLAALAARDQLSESAVVELLIESAARGQR